MARLRGSGALWPHHHPLGACDGATYQEQRRGPDEHKVLLLGEHLGQVVVEPVQHVAHRLVVQVAADLPDETRGEATGEKVGVFSAAQPV